MNRPTNIRLLFLFCLTFLFVASALADPPVPDQIGLDSKGNKVDRRTGALGSGGSQYSRKNGPDRRTGLYRSPNRGVRHLWGFWQDDSYSFLKSDLPSVSFKPGGWSASLGFCYEYQSDRLRFQLGGGIRWQDVKNRVADSTIVRDYVRDTQGYRYRLQYDFRNRIDQARNFYVQPLCLSVGYGFYGAYFMVGAKLNIPIQDLGSTCVLDTGVTTGTYSQYLGHFVEMDNHGLRKDVPYYMTNKPALQLKCDILLSAEIGYEWTQEWETKLPKANRRRENKYKIAFFGEYGALNINPQNNYSAINIPEGPFQWDFSEFERQHIYSSDMMQGKHLHNFFFGIKLTFLTGMVIDYKCRLCSPFFSEADNL